MHLTDKTVEWYQTKTKIKNIKRMGGNREVELPAEHKNKVLWVQNKESEKF